MLWLVVLSAFPLAVLLTAGGGQAAQELSDDALVHLAVIGGICLVTTPIMGFQLGCENRWLQTVWVAAIGTGTLTAWYAALFLTTPNDPSAENAAGAGVVILAPATFATIMALLAMGGGLAAGVGRLRARRRGRVGT